MSTKRAAGPDNRDVKRARAETERKPSDEPVVKRAEIERNPSDEPAPKRARVSKKHKPEEPKAGPAAHVVILDTTAEDLAVMDWTQKLSGAEKAVVVLRDGPIDRAAWAQAGIGLWAAAGRLKQVTIKLAGTQPPSEWVAAEGMELRVTASWAGVPVGVVTLMFVDECNDWDKILVGGAGNREVVREEVGALSAYYAVPSGRPRVEHKRTCTFKLVGATIYDLSVLDEVTCLSLCNTTVGESTRLPPHLRSLRVQETGATLLRILEAAPTTLLTARFVVTDPVDGEWGRRVGALLARQPRIKWLALVLVHDNPLVRVEIPARVTTLTVRGADPTFGPGAVCLRELECLAVPITAPDRDRMTRLVRVVGQVGGWVAGVPSITELVVPPSRAWYAPLLPNLKLVIVNNYDHGPAAWSRVMCALAATHVPVELRMGLVLCLNELPEGTATYLFRSVPLDMIPRLPPTKRLSWMQPRLVPGFPVDPSREPELTPRTWLQPAVRKVVRQNMSLRDLCIGTLAARRASVDASRLPEHLANEVGDKVAEWVELGGQ